MTSRATSSHILPEDHGGLLIQRLPLRDGAVESRQVFVTTKISEALDGKDGNVAGFPWTQADVLIGKFCAGQLVKVALTSKKDGKFIKRGRYGWPEIERMDGVDEVWILCIRKPQPGWRILGRFLRKNCFIGLELHDAHDLHKPDDAYNNAAQKVIEVWNVVFGQQEPHRGKQIDDYMSGVWIDVNETQ